MHSECSGWRKLTSEVLAEMSSTSLPLTDLVAELPPEQLGGWVGEMPKDAPRPGITLSSTATQPEEAARICSRLGMASGLEEVLVS